MPVLRCELLLTPFEQVLAVLVFFRFIHHLCHSIGLVGKIAVHPLRYERIMVFQLEFATIKYTMITNGLECEVIVSVNTSILWIENITDFFVVPPVYTRMPHDCPDLVAISQHKYPWLIQP